MRKKIKYVKINEKLPFYNRLYPKFPLRSPDYLPILRSTWKKNKSLMSSGWLESHTTCIFHLLGNLLINIDLFIQLYSNCLLLLSAIIIVSHRRQGRHITQECYDINNQQLKCSKFISLYQYTHCMNNNCLFIIAFHRNFLNSSILSSCCYYYCFNLI